MKKNKKQKNKIKNKTEQNRTKTKNQTNKLQQPVLFTGSHQTFLCF